MENKENMNIENAEKKSKKKKNNLIFIICLIVLICAVVICVCKGYSKWKGNQTYEELKPEVAGTVVSVPVEEEVTNPIDFAELQSQYPDAYAWISIPDTPVDYPIVQSSEDMDEDYYLDHTIDGAETLPGAIYTQRTQNSNDMTDPVTLIYGHNMRNDSMFGSLNEYQNEEYRTQHPYIYVYTPDHIYTYQIFGAVTYTDDHILKKYDCNNSDSGYKEFLNSLEESPYAVKWLDEKIKVKTKDRIIVLSTCNNIDDQRYLICAKLIEEQEVN